MSKHKTTTEMYPLIAAWELSRDSQLQFCQSHRISPSVFTYWRKKYQEDKSSQSFTEILPQLEEPLEIHYPNGVHIKVPSGCSPNTLQALIQLS